MYCSLYSCSDKNFAFKEYVFQRKKHMCSYSDNLLCVMMWCKGLAFSDWISAASWFSFGPSGRTPPFLLCWTEEAGNTQVTNHWWMPRPLVEAGVGPRGCWWFVWWQWQWGYVPRVTFCRVNTPVIFSSLRPFPNSSSPFHQSPNCYFLHWSKGWSSCFSFYTSSCGFSLGFSLSYDRTEPWTLLLPHHLLDLEVNKHSIFSF